MSDSAISQISRPRALRATTLDAWSSANWGDGIDVKSLAAFDELTVTTKNSVYTIVIVAPQSGHVKVRGGTAFPSFEDALLSGSSLGGGLLRRHLVHPGFCLELTHKGLGRIVTTRVRAVSLVRSSESGRSTPLM